MDWPTGKYGAIYADPPWRFETYNEKGRGRSPDWKTAKGMPMHYSTMPLDDICALPVSEIAADDSVLFMWICWPLMPDALRVINAWGFAYKTCAFDWAKMKFKHLGQVELFDEIEPIGPADQIGCGYWTRSNTEVCLLAAKGKPKRKFADVRMLVMEPRREHSRKPDCVYDRIERLVDGPYLELFARTQRPGWTAWGNQTDKFRVSA